jgi:hypothetical protein
MAIHGFLNMVIHTRCLVGWIGRIIFLFGWMDICRMGRDRARHFFCLVGWMKMDRLMMSSGTHLSFI